MGGLDILPPPVREENPVQVTGFPSYFPPLFFIGANEMKFIVSIHRVRNLLVEGNSPEEVLQSVDGDGGRVLYDGGIVTYKDIYLLSSDSMRMDRAVLLKIEGEGEKL